MKKMYIKPIVETENLEIIGQALCASPTGISAGTGGTTGSMGSGDPIGGD